MLESPNGMSAAGDGPKIMLVASPFIAAAIVARVVWPQLMRIGLPEGFLTVSGLVLVALGVLLWLSAIVVFVREFPKGHLITTGPYALCRHPIYASFALFVLPGVGLLTGSWAFFIAAAALLAASKHYVRGEDAHLARLFGAEYHLYRARVPEFFPLPQPQRPMPPLES